jgi:hypothetical protein
MKTIPSLVNIIGLKVYHGSPGYETIEVIADVLPDENDNRVKVIFESHYNANMSNEELERFMDEGSVSYNHCDELYTGMCRMFLTEEQYRLEKLLTCPTI